MRGQLSLNIGNLPGLFTANGITLIRVQTSSKTSFENASDLSGFVDGTSVLVRGFLSAAPRLRYSSRTKLGSAEPEKEVRALSGLDARPSPDKLLQRPAELPQGL